MKKIHLFQKKNSSTPKEQEPPKLQFRRIRFPRMYLAVKKRPVAIMALTAGILLAAGGITWGVIESNKRKSIPVQVVVETNKEPHRIYLLGNDQYVVPLTIHLEKKDNFEEKISSLLPYLKEDTPYRSNYLRGYLPKDTKILSVTLDGHRLTINFSKEFNDIKETCHLRVLEALSHTFLDVKEVRSVTFQVEGKDLTKLGEIPVPKSIDRRFGINQVTSDLKDLQKKTRTTIFYQRNYDEENQFVIPVSVLVDNAKNDYTNMYRGTQVSMPTRTKLKNVEDYGAINLQKTPKIDNGTVTYEVQKSALQDEVTIRKSVFELLRLTTDFIAPDTKVNLTYQDEVYQVDGYVKSDEVEVGAIVYNEVAI